MAGERRLGHVAGMSAGTSPTKATALRDRPRLPIPYLLECIDRFLGGAGPFSRQEFEHTAIRRTGLSDFGDPCYAEALQRLLESYNKEANLSALGKRTARWDVLRFLSNLLLLARAEACDPTIREQHIREPIFITGLPRSATTFLHNLFCQDSASHYVRCWETIYPYAERSGPVADGDARAAKVDRHLRAFSWIAPEVGLIHPMTARSPQECTEITAHVFRSLRFDTTHNVPGYQSWLDAAGHREAYAFHRRFLQHLQRRRGPGRWILKTPDHVFALDAIREIYPDARFIFMHRDPLEVLPSVAELTEVLRRPFTRALDRRQIGRQVTTRWAHGAEILIREAEKFPDCAQVAHLEFRAFVENPVRSVAALYDRFGLPFTDVLAEQMHRFIAAWPNGGYRRDKTLLEEYGLSPESERYRYQGYMAHFGF